MHEWHKLQCVRLFQREYKNVTEVLQGEPLLYNRFMHINEMVMKVRWPSPW